MHASCIILKVINFNLILDNGMLAMLLSLIKIAVAYLLGHSN